MKTGYSRMLVQAICGIALLAILGTVWAHTNPAVSPTAGGRGGEAFRVNCGHDAGRILIGVTGRSGGYVDSIRGICATVDRVLMMTDIGRTVSRGGSGGSRSYEFRCPTGHALVGLHGRAGSYVDAIGIQCAPITRDGLIDPREISRPDGFSGSIAARTSGGGGGNPFSITCPGNLPARSLQGRAGGFVDQVQLGCHPATVPRISTTLSAGPVDAAVAIRGMPFAADRSNGISATIELWNVGTTVLPYREFTGGSSGASAVVDVAFGGGVAFPSLDAGFTGNGTCETRRNPPRCRPHHAVNPGERFSFTVSWGGGGSSAGRGSVTATAGFEGRVIERSTADNSFTAEAR